MQRYRDQPDLALGNGKLIVSPTLARQRYFQEFVQREELAGRPFIVQGAGEYIQADEVIFARTYLGNRAHLEALCRMVAVPPPDPTAHRKVFYTALKASDRCATWKIPRKYCP